MAEIRIHCRAVLIHGINEEDSGNSTWERMGEALFWAGVRTYQFRYGDFNPLDALWGNPGEAEKLAHITQPGDVYIAHSNGRALAYRAAQLGAPVRGIIGINGALDDDLEEAEQVEWVLDFYSDSDYAVLAADLIPGTIWGARGRRGYTGRDPRNLNLDEEELMGDAFVTHSEVLRSEFFAQTVARIVCGEPLVDARVPEAVRDAVSEWYARTRVDDA